MSDLRYDRMVEEALRSVVAKALAYAAEHGLPGGHHFYITFRTGHPGVVLPEHLRRRFPGEMTIVLQYQFWGLDVGPEAFAVTLSFSDVPERLTVPYEAVVAFADPSVRFGLQFDVEQSAEGARAEEAEPRQPASDSEGSNLVELNAEREKDDGPAEEVEKVVPLDAFRKK